MNSKKSTFFLGLFLLVLFGFAPTSDWDGVLLITKKDNKFYAFVDQVSSTEELQIISYLDDKRTSTPINSKGDVAELPMTENSKGYVAVKKGNQIVSSVLINQIRYSDNDYFEERVAKAGGSLAAATVASSTQTKEEEPVVKDNQPITPPAEVEEKDSVEVVTVVKETEEEEEIEIDIPEEEAASSTFEMSVYEEFLVYNHYKHSMKNVDEIKSRDDLTPEIIEEAKYLEGEFEVLNDYYSWLHLKDKEKGDEWAFDGEYLFKIIPKYFVLKDTEKYELKVFRDEHDVRVKPHNKKWVGIYFRDHLLSEFKSEDGYTFKKVDNNNFNINIMKHEYKVNCSPDHVTIRKDGKVIEHFNTESLKEEPVPVFD
ncbi:hypothetical protein KMW28_16310 [Flammeovirga yaeyamensis]|uniref:Uncharacterized protein n=1 Tax=Flammeovirga yaeyamensis TaxID=367791 RepID=A0AAX1N5T8_9BACT|nr:hypothetical protein [Flammeovirga yaeyamensis]MBB3698426.1 hypothetical protein [Flammeovirga yaeyamensis]NMF34224.1 hypothetical protein [Flammeovirga yaeyamensis]QWG01208.1 hypothetical protein KMW28_16310 [Flammeovirga yaeyamensis]